MSTDRFCSMVLIKEGDKFLGVSRKDDHADIGVPSGKSEGDETPSECAIRETLEETGYTVTLLDKEPYVAPGLFCTCYTYLAVIDTSIKRAPIAEEETGIVGFFDKQAFLDGCFGEHNDGMFTHFGE